MRPSRPSHRPILRDAVLCAAAILASSAARAAADDQVAAATPMAAAPAPTGLVASARRLIDDTLEKERAVVAVLRQNVGSHVMASSWRLSVGTPYVLRVTAIASRRPVPNGVVGEAPSPSSSGQDAELPLGARWRVVHGDATSNVPVAAWMPDLQTADARSTALRPTLNLSGEWALPDDFSLGVMPGIVVDYSAQGRRQSSGTIAVTLGKAWSPQWRTFVDMARDRVGPLQVAGASTNLDAGVSFLAAPGTQIDFAVTHGLSESAPAFQAGLGLSSAF